MSSGSATPLHTPPSGRRFRSKTVTALLACTLGWLGVHRFYLYGRRDPFGWLHLLGAVIGMAGLALLVQTERDSLLGWVLVLPGDVTLLTGFLSAIVFGLRPDDKWDAQFNAAMAQHSRSGWSVVLLVIASLFIGACVLMGGIALVFQTYFEHQPGISTSLSQ